MKNQVKWVLRAAWLCFTAAGLAQNGAAPSAKPELKPAADKDSAGATDKTVRERSDVMERFLKAIDDRLNSRMAELRRETIAQKGGQLLAHSVRLEFRLEPATTDERPLVVRTATDRFTMSVNSKAKTQGVNIRVSGQIQLIDDRQILVIYDANLDPIAADGGPNTSISGGVKLQPGRPVTLATLGDRSWLLVGTLDEEVAPMVDKDIKPVPDKNAKAAVDK